MKRHYSRSIVGNRTRIRKRAPSLLSSSWVALILLFLGSNQKFCEALSARRKVASNFAPISSQEEERNLRLLLELQENSNKKNPLSSTSLLGLRGGAVSTTKKKSKKKNKKKSAAAAPTKKKNKKATKAKGGGNTVVKTKKNKKTKNKKTKKKNKKKDDTKKAIGKAMEEKDAAKALGDAIRSRAEELRRENPLLSLKMDRSDTGIGLVPDFVANLDEGPSSSSSSGFQYYLEQVLLDDYDDVVDVDGDGGVAGSPTAVVVSYFLKSQGDSNGLQCFCSMVSALMGLGSLLVPSSFNNKLRQVLLKQSVLFATTKHIAWVLGRAILIAKSSTIPGGQTTKQARIWLEQLSKDPICHYIFYTACLLLWLPSTGGGTTKTPITFAGDIPWISALLVGPILLREVVSTLLAISDILVLFMTSTSTDNQYATHNDTIERILQISQKGINIFMSLLVTPKRWRNANPAGRQRILAKLISKVSLYLEGLVGIVFVLDALVQMGRLVVMGGGKTAGGGMMVTKPSFGFVIKRLLCSRIYLQYLLSRRQKIQKLVTEIQDGLGKLPFYILEVMMNPIAAMGLLPPEQDLSRPATTKRKKKLVEELTWEDYLILGLGLDELTTNR